MSAPLTGKRVLLTGGGGFIGSHLAVALASENEVHVVDNLYRHAEKPAWLASVPGLRFLRSDVRDAVAVRQFVPRDVTHIVDLAAVAGVGTVIGDPVAATRSNLEASLAVIALAEASPRLEHFVYFSSSEVYGPKAEGVAEGDVQFRFCLEEPRWTYAVSKLAAEALLFQLWRERHFPVTIVRPFNVYGPGQLGESAVHAFASQALAGLPLTIRGSGTQQRAWCYVDDFIAGLGQILARRPLGQALNLGNPTAVCRTRELAERVRSAAGSSSPIEEVPLEWEDVEVRVPDITRASRLGFAPRVGLTEGLSRTVTWYRSHEHAPAQERRVG